MNKLVGRLCAVTSDDAAGIMEAEVPPRALLVADQCFDRKTVGIKHDQGLISVRIRNIDVEGEGLQRLIGRSVSLELHAA